MSTILGKSISDLKSSITAHGGLAHTNRFAVYMALPSPLQSIISNILVPNRIDPAVLSSLSLYNSSDPRDITILCESCALPGRQITTLDYQTFRQPEKLPYGYINEDVTFSFLLTNDYYAKKIFDTWQSMVISNDTYHIRYQEEFVSDIVIQQLNKRNEPVYEVVLKGAYPISFFSIPLDNTSENSIQKCTVTVTYEDFAVKSSTKAFAKPAESLKFLGGEPTIKYSVSPIA